MIRILICFLVLVNFGCSSKLYVPLTDVKLVNQDIDIYLGTNRLKVVVSKVCFNPVTKYYSVWGYTDLTRAPDRNYAKYPEIKIKRIHGGDTSVYGTTNKWGTFKIKMYNSDTILFDYDQYKFLIIDYSY